MLTAARVRGCLAATIAGLIIGMAPSVTVRPMAQEAAQSLAAMSTQPSMNIFRRFSVDRAKMLEFYGEVLGLRALPTFGMPGGGQMSLFQIGTGQVKLTTEAAGRRPPSGSVKDVIGLRVLTFFYRDGNALATRFMSHGLAAPAFTSIGTTRMAMVQDPDGQWVELVVDPRASDEVLTHVEVGLTVSDIDRSRAFYREFVGLEELAPADEPLLGVKKYPYRHGTTTVNLWTFGKGLPVNTTSAGIQYVVSDVATVDARAKAAGVTITQPLGPFGTGLRTIWLADPDGVTNYFAQILRRQ